MPLPVAGRIVIARYARNRRLGDALLLQAFADLKPPGPGPTTTPAEPAAPPTTRHYAVANRLVGIRHGCLRNHALYDEQTAWHTTTPPHAPTSPLDELAP